MDNVKAFYLSAIIAIGVYISLVFLFLFYIKEGSVKKIDAISKSTILQLDIIIDQPKDIKKQIKISSKDIISKKNTVVKKSTSVSAKRKTNLKSLFANVKTKSAKVVKQKVMNVKESSIASRYKSKFEKVKKANNVSLKDLDNSNRNNIKNVISSESKNESDPYYSKIYQLISSRWQPTIFFNNLKAKILISISNSGQFNYQFIQYSDNMGFDNQLKMFLDKEKLIQYPINPNNRSTKIEITFQSKGE